MAIRGFGRSADRVQDGNEVVCFGISKFGEWRRAGSPTALVYGGHPRRDRDLERHEYILMHLDVESVDAEAVTVLEQKGELTV